MGNKLSIINFIERSKKIHNNKYDYSISIFSGVHYKIKIICPFHGEFEQRAKEHLEGHGCKKCKIDKLKKLTSNTEIFISKCKKIHGELYDYSLVNYINANTKVDIICKTHGIFKQKPSEHLSKKGCPICGGKIKMNTISFILKSNKKHFNKYDYSLVNYINSKTKVKIICKKHNLIFEQLPAAHISGNGCPICKESKGEEQISIFLKNNNIEFIRQKSFKNCKNKNNLLFDFYLPKFNICIEYDGIQHFKPIKKWGGENNLKEIQNRDKIKNSYCNLNNIYLYRINYKENIQDKLWQLDIKN